MGIRLAADGHKVRIIEKNSVPGGAAGRIDINGFRFDTGPSIITAPFLLTQLFEYAGKKLDDYIKLQELDPIFSAVFPEALTPDIHFPENKVYQNKEYLFYREPAAAMFHNNIFSAAEQKAFHDFEMASDQMMKPVFMDYCSQEPAPNPFPLFSRSKIQNLQPNITLEQSVNHWFRSAEMADWPSYIALKELFKFWPILAGCNPAEGSHLFRIMPSILHEWSAFAPVGGMGILTEALVKLFWECGGEIALNSEVQAVQVFNHNATGIRLKDGSLQQADVIISDADVFSTFQNLIDSDKTKYSDVENSKNQTAGLGMFIYHMGLKQKLEEKIPLLANNVIFPLNYQNYIEDIFHKKVFPNDPFMILRIPDRIDEKAVPHGCESISVLVPVPNLQTDLHWNHKSYFYREKVIDSVQKLFDTDLRTNLVIEKFEDPLMVRQKSNILWGNSFGISPEINKHGGKFFSHRFSDIHNLYMVGAGTHPGPFIPGVLMGASITAQMIIDDNS